MKRTTIVLSDEQAILLERERRRRGVPAAVVVRDALDAYFSPAAGPLPFVALGASGESNIAQDAEEILHREWIIHLLEESSSDVPGSEPTSGQAADRFDASTIDVGDSTSTSHAHDRAEAKQADGPANSIDADADADRAQDVH
jgi:hypothetical protein